MGKRLPNTMTEGDPDFQRFQDAKQQVRDLQAFFKEMFVEEECDGTVPFCASCAAKRAIADLEFMWNLADV